MNANEDLSPDEYRCPGEKGVVSKAVHLGRLTAFYPACRQCSRRDETGTLSPRQVSQLAETQRRIPRQSPFYAEGAAGVFLNDLTPALVRDVAAVFAALTNGEQQKNGKKTGRLGDEETGRFGATTMLLAGDARPLTAELVAAAAEGVRSTGCNVIDIGPATTACLAFAVRHLRADGGLAVGNPGDDPHSAGLKFFDAAAMPLSTGGSLEPIVERYEAGDRKPSRRYGRLHRFQADAPYLAAMAEQYHALRPLRIAVDSASKPWADYFQKLIGGTACEILRRRTVRNEFPQQIRDDAAHLGVRIDGDGETCRAFDQQGREISPDRLFLLLAKNTAGEANRLAAVETGTSPAVIEQLKQHGMQIIASGPRRAEMATAMSQHSAMFGGGPSGRYWHALAGVPLPDALMTVTGLLKILSRSDEPFSRVLDREAKIG